MSEPISQALLNLLKELLRSATTRNEEGRFVVEGPHLLEEALKHKAKLTLIAHTDAAWQQHSQLILRAVNAGAIEYKLSAKQAERISDTEAPQGIFTLVSFPEPRQGKEEKFVLVLDEVQDPGNVGTLIRTAAWFSISSVILGPGTADPFNPKVVRATQGAVFSVALKRSKDLVKELKDLKKSGYSIASTSLEKNSTDLFRSSIKTPLAMILGSEARGVKKELQELSDHKLYIPKLGSGESLNVAVSGGIVMSYLTKSLQGDNG
jgi:RNA methyltransferase, TrmH family